MLNVLSDDDCPIDKATGVQMKCDPKTHTCQPAECYTNPDCLGEYPNLRCCDRDPSLPEEIRSKGEGKCYDKGETIGKGEWICDPGKWVKCDENNLGETVHSCFYKPRAIF